MIFVDFFVSGAVYFSEPITRIYRAAASRPRGGVAGFLVSLVTEILLSQNSISIYRIGQFFDVIWANAIWLKDIIFHKV